MRIRILVVDDHQLVREGLRLLIAGFADCEVIADAKEGAEARRLARELAPDIVLLDINMPGQNGVQICRHVLAEQPQSKVVMLSMHSDQDYVLRSVEAGAKGYVLKDSAPEELEQALRQVMRGGSYFSPQVTGALMARLRGGVEPAPAVTLSMRQHEVLRLICEGHSNRSIGQRLHISPKTVDTHRTQLMQKLGIHDVAGLTRYAMRIGLIA